MAVDQGHALLGERRHVGRGVVVDRAGAQPVGDEDHDVMGGGAGRGRPGRRLGHDGGREHDEAGSENSPNLHENPRVTNDGDPAHPTKND